MLTSRKHCHHGISTCNSGSSRGGAAASGVHSLRERCFRKVERGDLMACLCQVRGHAAAHIAQAANCDLHIIQRSEEHTSELQPLMRISYAVFCLKQKIYKRKQSQHPQSTIKTTQSQSA